MLAQLTLQEGEALLLLKEYLDLVQVIPVFFDLDFTPDQVPLSSFNFDFSLVQVPLVLSLILKYS